MLKPGSRVAIISPAGLHDAARLARGLDLIRGWGLVPLPAPNLGARHRYTAGTVAQRRADLTWALQAPAVDAVWLSRGGFGSIHLLDGLAELVVDDRPLIGFSDATALFSALDPARTLGGLGRSIHGPVLQSLVDHADADSRAALRELLVGSGAVAMSGRLLEPRLGAPIRGRLVGGNLCVLASLAGTAWALGAHDSIVVLEDVGEPAYKLDRLLSQLILSGGLAGAAAVALGSFTNCSVPADADWTVQDVLVELLAPLGLSILVDLPVGHGPANHPWLWGAMAELSVDGLLRQSAREKPLAEKPPAEKPLAEDPVVEGA